VVVLAYTVAPIRGGVGSSAVEASQLPERLRRDLLSYLSATSEERARLIGELTQRNSGMADLLVDLEANATMRDRFELELLRSLGT
jgi:hypothetical protein